MEQPSERDPGHGDVVPRRYRTNRIDDPVGMFAFNRRKIEAVASRVVGTRRVTAELTAEQSAGDRTPDHEAEALLCHQRDDLPLDVSAGVETSPSLLRGNADSLHDFPSHQVRAADIANLAGLNEIVECAHPIRPLTLVATITSFRAIPRSLSAGPSMRSASPSE
jgi:hypothetical protein